MSATDNNDNAAGGEQDNMASIPTLLQSPVDRLDRLEQTGDRTRSLDREITPAESVFGDKAFRPTGYAALPEFIPYGDDHNSKNSSYDNRARHSQYKPGVFT
ncbi:hypothetical protein E4U19_006902 [Claviceps sp. Clav32 group G5]|nr:hypothetical protein E4U19_006902 [Claviceps sp. Clav32 group G5]KAG6020964.1 hypothetical protein E4U40_005691 [Claviceps sp. LM458 group G5]KAG6041546.1 hypothetical protein E4U39_006518 [Claviceps sp. Clav50 group G5]